MTQIPNGAHLVYLFPVWTLATWTLLLILAYCTVGLKRKVDRLTDKVREFSGRQDAYFGLPLEDAEAIRIRDMEVRRIREDRRVPQSDDEVDE